ncbi:MULTISPECIES: DsbA family protein [Roseomonadaceae]|uniref:DsbA family protein n=1 Tax=Falsiroseomonas oleicola TaxID=2801474 RepID=A0ABS6H961_9PROT|nr:DsbA family protein [Roseomonas oleicola]MBU8545252.1 DsbA family protein [Roseomonas oleicola]
MTTGTPITYLFDPLCGWCYGAAPVLDQLASLPGLALELAPTGLFAGAGARPMEPRFAAYAWSNDQRIARLTGQVFSEAYRHRVLADTARLFDSGPATLALTAVVLTDPDRMRPALRAIQHARYVAGEDITDTALLARILTEAGLPDAAARLAAPDAALRAALGQHITASQALMQEMGAEGVPALVVGTGPSCRLLPASVLFGGADALLGSLAAA